MLGLGFLQPAASGIRTLLAVILSAGWALFLVAFFALPTYLNALINDVAAASPLSAPYYRRRQRTRSSKAASGECVGGAAGNSGNARAAADSPAGPEASSTAITDDDGSCPDAHCRYRQPSPHAHDLGASRPSSATSVVIAAHASASEFTSAGRSSAPQPSAPIPASAPASAPSLRVIRRNVWARPERPVGRRAAHAAVPAQRTAAAAACSESGSGTAGGADGLVMSFDECMRLYGKVPSLNVVIMVAGTRGDVQPATALGARLRAHGHRVRLASHEPYRGLVAGAGLEFFPLAGDPRGMMELTVKHRGMLFSSLTDMVWLRRQYAAIMDSCWDACTSPSPPQSAPQPEPHRGEGEGRQAEEGFKPDLVIATAITYGGVHCAEALGVPLHVISTIPWRPTQEICHPWARGFDDTLTGHCAALAAAALPPPPGWAKGTTLGAAYGKFAAAARAATAAAANWWSCALLDHTAWLGIADLVAAFRARLGLPLLSPRNSGFALYDVPTTFTFSPALVPRPRDWGAHVEVSGPLLLPAESPGGGGGGCEAPGAEAGGGAGSGYQPPQALIQFLERDPDRKPIYIGFGSMTVSEGKAVAAAIRQAVSATGVRAIVSAGGWACLSPEDCSGAASGSGEYGDCGSGAAAGGAAGAGGEGRAASGSAGSGMDGAVASGGPSSSGPTSKAEMLIIQDVPHDWLFPRCSAVIHHGGVGTTAAGLLAGCPTFVAPSFGDLFFWGELVSRVGVGPPPVPIYNLSARDLDKAIRVLQTDAARDAAKRAGALLRQSDGVEAATQHVYRGLLCERVSLG